jgi:hypothetical protein
MIVYGNIQAIQLAYYKVHGLTNGPVATYESAHSRLFFHGRTETIRSTSTESLAFVSAMLDPNASVCIQDKIRSLKYNTCWL